MTDTQRNEVSADAQSPSGTVRHPRIRRIRFRFGEKGTAPVKYFAGDDMVMSHFTAAISASFPPGEESFIRSVRQFSDQITDPVLKKRVAGFIGQESVHGQNTAASTGS